MMNAINFLIHEHNKVKQLLENIEQNHSYHKKKIIFDKVCSELLVHEKMEKEIWYPYFRYKLDNTVQHLVSEENSAEKAISSIKSIDDEERWNEKFKKFKSQVEHHVEEEENRLFPIAKEILHKTQLRNIGKQMRRFKQKCYSK